MLCLHSCLNLKLGMASNFLHYCSVVFVFSSNFDVLGCVSVTVQCLESNSELNWSKLMIFGYMGYVLSTHYLGPVLLQILARQIVLFVDFQFHNLESVQFLCRVPNLIIYFCSVHKFIRLMPITPQLSLGLKQCSGGVWERTSHHLMASQMMARLSLVLILKMILMILVIEIYTCKSEAALSMNFRLIFLMFVYYFDDCIFVVDLHIAYLTRCLTLTLMLAHCVVCFLTGDGSAIKAGEIWLKNNNINGDD